MARAEAKDRRRQELIEATISAIARHGLVGTTLAGIAKEAKVGYGVVSFHFGSKDALLLATLDALAEEYEAAAAEALRRAGPDPAARLRALLDCDFSPAIASRRKIAAWTAFWSESRATPAFRRRCAELQDSYLAMTAGLCAEIAGRGGYGEVRPRAVAAALNAMVNGLWLEMQIRGRSFDRSRARQAWLALLAAVFPKDFAAEEADAGAA